MNPKANASINQPMGLDRFNHFGVGVSDLERSVKFYTTLTGGEVSGRGTWESEALGKATGANQNAKIHWAAVRMGNVNTDLLEVLKPDDPAAEYKMDQPGALHVCFEVDDIEAVYGRMQQAGIEFLGPWHRISQEVDGAEQGMGTAVAYFNGPDGELLELIEPAGPFVRQEKLQAEQA